MAVGRGTRHIQWSCYDPPIDVRSCHENEVSWCQETSFSWQERNLVFCTSFGTPLNPNWILGRFKKLLARAGLPDMRFHDLRHSIATLLLSMGNTPKSRAGTVGHNRIQETVDIYSQVMPAIHKEAIKKLEDVLWK